MAVKRIMVAAVMDQFGHPQGRAGSVAGGCGRRVHRHRLPASYRRGPRPPARSKPCSPDAGYTETRTKTLDLGPPVACILAVNPDRAATAARLRQISYR
jgi:hypothetical protein